MSNHLLHRARFMQHSHFFGVSEDAACFDDGGDFAQGLEGPMVAGRAIAEDAGHGVDLDFIAGANLFAKPVGRTRMGSDSRR